MNKQEKRLYEDTGVLKHMIENLKGRKFRLDCGHHVTFGYWLGNDITIINGKKPKIICSFCGR